MKLTEHYMKREIAGEVILIPVGEMATKFNGMITLNETGIFIYQCLKKEMDREEIIRAMLEEYEGDEAVIRQEAEKFLNQCEQIGVVEV